MTNYSTPRPIKAKLHATIEASNMAYLQSLKRSHNIGLSQAVDLALKIAREIQSDEQTAERITERVCQKLLEKLAEKQQNIQEI